MRLDELLKNDITMEDALKELTRQYKWYNNQIKQAQERLNLKNKMMIFYIILFIYVWSVVIVGTITIFKNKLLQTLIGCIAFFGNINVYIHFFKYYIVEEYNEIQRYITEQKKLYVEISKALEYLNIEKDNYFYSIN